eukprot:g7036.t1
MAAFVSPTEADLAAAVPFAPDADFADVMDAVSVVEHGCKVFDLRRVVVAPALHTLAREKDTDEMILLLKPLIKAHPQASEPPVMQDLISAARGSGHDLATQTRAAARLMLQATVEFLYKRDDHGGLRYVPDRWTA